MSTDAISAGTPLLDQGIRAVNFFNGRLVTSGDLSRDQQARREGDARLGQANGSGVVCGLEVTMDGVASDRRLAVKAGLAVNRAGQTLCLGNDQVLALVPAADEDPPETGGGFGACAQLSGGTYVAGDGVFIVTLAPVLRPEGRAPVLALEPGNVRCNTDVMVEAVQLRLLRVGSSMLDAHGLDTNVVAPQAVSRLRSSIAAASFGLPHQRAAHVAPGTAPALNLIDDMRDRGLAKCDVPLALVYLTTSDGIRFVDRWAVRRRIASGIAAPGWAAWLGEPLDATAQAQLAQFQEQLDDIPEGSLTGLQAAAWFAWLPPAGVLKTRTTAIAWDTFLDNRKPARTVPLEPGDAPAVLAEALRREAVQLAPGDPTKFRVYEIAGGPRLFVRNAPNARHAEEVWFDRAAVAGMTSDWNVQAAIAELWARSYVQVVIRSAADFARFASQLHGSSGTDLMLCIEPGTYELSEPVRIEGKRHVIVQGHGYGTVLRCSAKQTALFVDRCDSLEICDLAVEGLRPSENVVGAIGRGGALLVLDVPDVRVRRVRASCGGEAAHLDAGALVVTHRDAEPEAARHVIVEDCSLLVAPGQQGLACIHCQVVTLRNNVVRRARDDSPMRLGIVVAGAAASEVRIADNLVYGAAQGIKVALSQKEDKPGESLKVEHLTLQGNRIEVALMEEDKTDPPPYFGIGIGNAESLLVRDNRILGRNTWPAALRELNMGVHLHGDYGPRLLVRENHVTGFDIGVELVSTAEEKPDGLWSVHSNVFDTRTMLVAPGWLKSLANKGDRNVQV